MTSTVKPFNSDANSEVRMEKFDAWLVRAAWHIPGQIRMYIEFLTHDKGQMILPFALTGKDAADLDRALQRELASVNPELDLQTTMILVADYLDREFGADFSGQVYLHSEYLQDPNKLNHRFIFNPFADRPKLIDIRNRRNDR